MTAVGCLALYVGAILALVAAAWWIPLPFVAVALVAAVRA